MINLLLCAAIVVISVCPTLDRPRNIARSLIQPDSTARANARLIETHAAHLDAAHLKVENAGTRVPSDDPWGPSDKCRLNAHNYSGLHPGALSALQTIGVAHRITQGINHKRESGNVHGTDGTVGGKEYTGAVDISSRCLTDDQVKALLGRLADEGFAAWYRQTGKDGWPSVTHIHAVWAGCSLKPILRAQIEDWLVGKNGLGSHALYRFWLPSEESKKNLRTLYAKSN